MKALFIDDERTCPEGFILARTVEEALHLSCEHAFDILSIDHDMGFDVKSCKLAKTGYDYINQLCDPVDTNIRKTNLQLIFLHTQNPVGRERMFKALLNAQHHGLIPRSVRIFPYPPPQSLFNLVQSTI